LAIIKQNTKEVQNKQKNQHAADLSKNFANKISAINKKYALHK